MARASLSTGIELEYDTFGSADDPAVLLVMGLATQMISWHDDFCGEIANAGRYVIRYDNRDCGLSTKFDGVDVDAMAVLAAAAAGDELPPVPYTLSDMAADGIGLLDHLGIDRAHVVGASMGGMIVQTMAIERRERLLSVTSIMSTYGDPLRVVVGDHDPQESGQASREAMQSVLSTQTTPPSDREGVIAGAAELAPFCSKRYFDQAEHAARLAAEYDRSFYPEGAPRQLAAISASGDRSDGLRGVTTPVLVVHGLDDVLVDPSGGRRTAELVPGASLLELADMGHDFPRPLWPVIVGTIVGFQQTAVADAVREVAA